MYSENYVPPALPASSQSQSHSNYQENKADETLLAKYVIEPRMFKHALAQRHPEFSGGHQQDVSEYYRYFLEQLERSERVNLPRLTYQGEGAPWTGSVFNFHFELKFREKDGAGVKLIRSGPQTLFNMLELPVPKHKGIPKPMEMKTEERTAETRENPDTKRPRLDESSSTEPPADDQLLIPFEACLESYFEPEEVNLDHPVLHRRVPFTKTVRFRHFPRYLVIKLSRYYVGENWTPKKINAEIPMPLEVDLTAYRASGLQGEEVELQEIGSTAGTESANAPSQASSSDFTIDETVLQSLTSMGFSENGCRRALLATRTMDMEVAMNWIIEHMEDPDFNDPPNTTSTNSNNVTTQLPSVSEESVQMLCAMGYTSEQCTAALIATDNNIER